MLSYVFRILWFFQILKVFSNSFSNAVSLNVKCGQHMNDEILLNSNSSFVNIT